MAVVRQEMGFFIGHAELRSEMRQGRASGAARGVC